MAGMDCSKSSLRGRCRTSLPSDCSVLRTAIACAAGGYAVATDEQRAVGRTRLARRAPCSRAWSRREELRMGSLQLWSDEVEAMRADARAVVAKGTGS